MKFTLCFSLLNQISIFENKMEIFIGDGILIDGLFKIDLNSDLKNKCLPLHTDIGRKQSIVNEEKINKLVEGFLGMKQVSGKSIHIEQVKVIFGLLVL
jgi:hypothetical protein